MKSYKNCQSCGMPLKRDPNGGSRNKDGSKNTMYCSLCYVNGEFVHPDWDVNQMRTFVKGKMKEMGFPGFIAGFFTRGIVKLERWRS